MRINFESLPNWCKRLLLFWIVGACCVAFFFVVVALFHIILVGALLGLFFFAGQSLYNYFFRASHIETKQTSVSSGKIYEHK